MHLGKLARRGIAGIAVGVGLAASVVPATALEFTFGDVSVSTITTLSAGMQMRVEDRDRRFLQVTNGGDPAIGLTANVDAANKHFDKWDLVSTPTRIVQELDASWRNFGVYARGTAFYDAILDNNNLAKYGDNGAFDYGRLVKGAKDRAAYGAEMQDYFVRGEFDIGSQPLNVRVGAQTLNWGEALYTQNAISVINPLDLQKLSTPGSELRDGLIPVPMAWASYEIVEGLAVEGFYQWQFEAAQLPPVGTFFSTADLIGGEVDSIGGVTSDFECGSTNSTIPCMRQLAAKNPGNDGNYGVKVNYFAPQLNNTEFGLYYIHYTSRFPTLSYVVTPGATGAVDVNGDPWAPGSTVSGPYFTNAYARAEYVKDIQLFGLSYNTTLDGPGVAVNGELSFKKDVPGGIYGSTPYAQVFCQTMGMYCGNQAQNYFGYGGVGSTGEVQGYVPLNAWNSNVRFTKVLFQADPIVQTMGAESLTIVSETAVTFIPNLPDAGTLSLSPDLTNACGFNTSFGGNGTCKVEQADSWSSATNLLLQLSYPSAFNTPVNLIPAVYLGGTLFGNSPIAAGAQSGFRSANLSLTADYQQNLKATINYAMQWGGDIRNQAKDKDFVGVTVNYTF
jgi:hypothetical protein